MPTDSGLKRSIWAPLNPKKPYTLRSEPRSRSVPPQGSPPPPPRPVVVPDLPKASTSIAAPLPRGSSLSPSHALQRFEQACQRLRWKFLDLEASYQRALAPDPWGFTAEDAERNFKIDFHEFYVWIEQAIVLLLLVWSISVPRDSFLSDKDRRTGGGAGASHAYHHNVLRRLDEEYNPLHSSLGSGDVNQALWKAKELRNRWKDAAEGKETPPLKMYDLRWIVREVLGGLEMAYVAAKEETVRAGESNGNEKDAEDGKGWDWMVDDMDWEA